MMTNRSKRERPALTRRLLGKSMAEGQIRLPAVPAMLDEIEDVCEQTFSALGVAFLAQQKDHLRKVLASQLQKAYQASPRAEIVIAYTVPVGLTVQYNVTLSVPTLGETYDNWTSTRQPPYFGSEPDARVLSLAHGLCPVLDIGAGTGRNALALARLGHPVDAVELSEVFAAILCQESEQHALPLRVLHGNIFDDMITLRSDYGLVVLSEVVSDFSHVDQLRQILKMSSDCLAPGGTLVFNMFLPKLGYSPDAAARELGLQLYSAIFTYPELASSTADLPLQLVADDPVLTYEQQHLPEGAWPPTGWYANWVSGLDVYDLPREHCPIEMRWLVYRKIAG